MKFGNIVRVETSRYLTKITTLRRKADRKSARGKVLAAKHTASLQLHWWRFGEPAYRSEIYFFFKGPLGESQIRYWHLISLNRHQLYAAIVANGCGCTQGPFWLSWRIAPVSQEIRIKAMKELPDVRFLFYLRLYYGRQNLNITLFL
jgi:hypothetical protein